MKTFRNWLYGIVLCVAVAWAGLASWPLVAQNAGQTLSTLLPADLIQVYRAGTAAVTYATPSQITSQSAYYKSVPGSLFTFTFANNQTYAAFRPAGTLAAGYVTLAPNPSDGAMQCVFSTQTITLLYVSASAGQSINNAVTTLLANTQACYLYSLSNTTWDRVQ